MTKPQRFFISQLNQHFVVTDAQRGPMTVVTDTGDTADVTKTDQVRYFGMPLDQAKDLKTSLNAKFGHNNG